MDQVQQQAVQDERRPELGESRAIVRLKNVHRGFGRLSVLRGVSLDIPEGRCTVILGPSGCGKSVLLKHIIGLLTPDHGEVWFDGERIDDLSEAALTPIRRQFGFLFQQGALFDSMSVRENIEFPLLEHTSLPASEREQRIIRVLEMVGLAESIKKMPMELSGGQRKRAALARAIVLEPRVILYDEPTTGLDPIRSDVINELILKLQKELKVTSIVVTHDLASAFKVADRMVMLHEGKVLWQGPAQDIRHADNPIVQRFLAGEASPKELEGIHRVNGSISSAGSGAGGGGGGGNGMHGFGPGATGHGASRAHESTAHGRTGDHR